MILFYFSIICKAHPNVKLFITHGGLHSIEEAIYNAKPMVAIPFFADQVTNVRIAEKNGYAKVVMFDKLSEETFESAIKEVLINPTYVYKKNPFLLQC